jgi:hypothetical protein
VKEETWEVWKAHLFGLCYLKMVLFFNSPGPTNISGPDCHLTSGVFALRGNQTMYLKDKYMFNPFSLPIELLAQLQIGLLAQLVVRIDWTCTYLMVHGSILTEDKNFTSKGVEKIVRWQSETLMLVGPELLHSPCIKTYSSSSFNFSLCKSTTDQPYLIFLSFSPFVSNFHSSS